jgi:hypothetical protein
MSEQARRICNDVRRLVRYKADKPGNDIWQSPATTEKLRVGDCEDFAILTLSRCRKAKIPARMVICWNPKSAHAVVAGDGWFGSERRVRAHAQPRGIRAPSVAMARHQDDGRVSNDATAQRGQAVTGWLTPAPRLYHLPVTNGGRVAVTLDDLIWVEDGRNVTLKRGFPTDGVSLPALALMWFDPWGAALRSALLHDAGYSLHDQADLTLGDKATVDRRFHAGLKLDQPDTATLYYRAVRWFGWLAWRKSQHRADDRIHLRRAARHRR